MLKNPEVDAVLISLPTHLHLKCASEAAEAKKDIFLEKPIAVTVEEAKEVISAAQRNSVKLMMGYPMRFNKHFLQLKEDMEMGYLATLKMLMQPTFALDLLFTVPMGMVLLQFQTGGLTRN